MKIRRLNLALALAFVLMGCGQTNLDNNLTGSAVEGPPASGGVTLRQDGRTVVVPPGSLTVPTTLTLPPAQLLPPLQHARALGSPVRLNLGRAESRGSIQVTFPELTKSNQEVLAVIEGSPHYIPLPLEGDTATLDLVTAEMPELGPPDQDGRDIHFVLAEAESTAGYQVWNTYNGYVFEKNGSGQVVRRPLVVQGVVSGPLPNLGSRPLMLVHGLGDTMHGDNRWTNVAQRYLDQGVVSGVVGFEYDTQDSAAHNGAFLRQYYGLLGEQKQWRHLAHSMGCVVSRSCFETGPLPISPNSNKVFFLCGPHQGSQAITVLQGRLSIAQRIFRYLVINGVMTFENADGRGCDADVQRPGFGDLRPASPLLQQLNAGAPGNHPQLDYATLGGNRRGLTYYVLDYMMGVWLDDGLVNLNSANFAGMGSVQANTAAVNHSEAVTESSSLNLAGQFFQP